MVVDDLAAIWIGWAEMELRHKHYEPTRRVEGGDVSLLQPSGINRSRRMGRYRGAYKHTKLWAFWTSRVFGHFEETKKCYEAMLDLKIITPQLVLNFGAFLEEHKHFEDAFQAYERGVANFKYPYVLQIWLTYLTKFVNRFKGTSSSVRGISSSRRSTSAHGHLSSAVLTVCQAGGGARFNAQRDGNLPEGRR